MLAGLALALTAAAQSFAAPAQPQHPPAQAAPTEVARPLTEAQLRKILDAMAQGGAIRSVATRITSPLGAGGDGEVLTSVQLQLADEAKQTHIIAKLDKRLGYLIVVELAGGSLGSRVYYLDEKLTLKRAAVESPTHQIVLVANDLAQKGLEAELKFWATAADANFG